MIRRTLLLGIVTVFASGATARAQDICSSCLDSLTGRWHILPALGLRGGIPQKASAAIGLVAGRNYRENGRTDDFVLYAEPGLSAGRATLGYHKGRGMGAGVGIGATALRTWKDPVNLETNQTYFGGEAWMWPAFFAGPRVGVFRQATGSRHGWFLTADIGFGL